MKGGRVKIPEKVPQHTLKQLYMNHTGVQKIRLLDRELGNWVSLNIDVENIIENCTLFLRF